MAPLITTEEAARQADTSVRMIRYHVKHGRLRVAKRSGTHLLFDPRDVAELERTIRNQPRRRPRRSTPSHAAFAVPAFAAPVDGLPGTLGVIIGAAAAAAAAGLVISGVLGTIDDRRADRARAAGQLPLDGRSFAEYITDEIAGSAVHVDPYRGRVYTCARGQFWRSRFDGWCFGQGARLVAVDDPQVVDALEVRDARERLSVVA